MLRAVVFDVGETLVDETREYGTWADWLGVPRHTFAAVFGAVIATGLDYREAFQVFSPGFDLDHERQARVDAGEPEWFGEDDLYRMSGRLCPVSARWVCGLVSSAIRPSVRVGYCEAWICLPTS
ncbi:hypothetical protein [Nocardia testacea]|uniref:Haloacid dehalogenase n=1 Tax=Nocardia testacea TaxID=248551 RepID=A0ABW7VSB9_9NOCA